MVKRDSSVQQFDETKIINAVLGAFEDVYGSKNVDTDIVDIITNDVLYNLESWGQTKIGIEDIQDMIEVSLMRKGYTKVAKQFILYRENRAQLRDQKHKILQTNTLDQVSKSFSLNQLKVLSERYLLREYSKDDKEGKIVESPSELFRRVATLMGLSDLLHDPEIFTLELQREYNLKEMVNPVNGISYEDYKYDLSERQINQYHFERFCNLFTQLTRRGETKVTFEELMGGYFFELFDSKYKAKIDQYYKLMTDCIFIPNTPTLMNAGTKNGKLSACFLKNQPIYTKNGVKPISEINVGDEVITHTGSSKKVTELFKRQSDKYFKLNVQNLYKPTLEVTEEHPILSLKKGDKVAYWRPIKDLQIGDLVAISYDKQIQDIDEIDIFQDIFMHLSDREYITQDDKIYVKNIDRHHLKISSVSRQIKPINSIIKIDSALMKLLGYYIADGNSDEDMVRFTYGWEDVELANETIRLMDSKFGISANIEYQKRNDGKEGKWITLRFHSKLLASVFHKWIGTGFDTKTIAKWIMLLSPQKQLELIKAIIYCDGTDYNKTGKNLRLSNHNIIYDIYNMLLRCGIVGTIRKAHMPKLATVQPYEITISGSQTLLILQKSDSEQSIVIEKPLHVKLNGEVFLPIKEIEEVNELVDVYNLEVEDDHSYLANFVSAHNCFTLDAEDNIESYLRNTVSDAASIYKGAGGVGINFSKFRPEGSSANGVPNAASGPISFMQMINTLTDVIKSGGKRRGANMSVLNISHPDVEKFITMKSTPGVLENFNVSVGIWEDYWNALTKGQNEYQLQHTTHHEKDRKVNPQHLWDLIALSAWKSAEPGVLFFDNANKVNHMKDDLGVLCISNPCGEQLLFPNSSCTLGSINISKFVTESGQFNWGDFGEVVRITTRFLDNVVSMNKYPTEKIEEMALKERRIGLGVMGVADALYMMKIPYNSKEGFEFMGEVCRQLTSISIDESVNLAMERGPAPLFKFETQGIDINNRRTRSSLSINQRQSDIYKDGIRNTWNTTIAPTGTIAMIAGCSYGIEPEFALGYSKKVTIGEFYYSNKHLEKALREEGIYSEELVQKIVQNGGSIQSIDEIPEHIKKVFITSMDLHWADHVMAQGVCQQYIDNSISKTINLAEDVIVDDVKNAYLLAHELGCKGMTIYRNNSRKEQVLHATSDKTGTQLRPSEYTLDYIKNRIDNQYVKDKLFQFFQIDRVLPEINEGPVGFSITPPDYEYYKKAVKFIEKESKDKCTTCQSKLIFQEGCKVCPNCQVSYCNV